MLWVKKTPDGDIEVNVEKAILAIQERKDESRQKTKRLRREKYRIEKDTESMILIAGDRCFKIVAFKEAENPTALLREEYDTKLEAEKMKILEQAEKEVAEFKQFAESTLKQSESEILQLKERLKDAAVMPEITYEHAKAGLSVVRGRLGGLFWMYRTVYIPEFLGDNKLNPSIIKRMITPIIILIETSRGNQVVSISTRTLTLDYFRHYHRSNSHTSTPGSDCWGSWYWNQRFETPDDVLKIAQTASNVLSTINPRSIACRKPRGLPRLATLEENLIRNTAEVKTLEESANTQRVAQAVQIASRRGGWSIR